MHNSAFFQTRLYVLAIQTFQFEFVQFQFRQQRVSFGLGLSIFRQKEISDSCQGNLAFLETQSEVSNFYS